MLRFAFLAVVLAAVVPPSTAAASDVIASGSIANAEQAASVCPATCAAHECGWSGGWRADFGANPGVCDCGIVRTRFVPGGYTPTHAEAERVCTETCGLNGDAWSGKVASAPGGYDMCGCTYVSEYCPVKK